MTALLYPRFAPVAPAHILKKMIQADARGLFGTYHLWLAHLVAENSAQYAEVLRMWYHHRDREPLHIIMDNSIVELGAATTMEAVAHAVNAAHIGSAGWNKIIIPVLPDVMESGTETIKLVLDSIEQWREHVSHPKGFMLVTQGSNWESFTHLVDFFFVQNRSDFPDITWAGIPRILLRSLGSRSAAVNYIQMVAPHLKTHLLGFSDDIFDDMTCARMQNVSGIDSAVPVRYLDCLSPSTPSSWIGKRPDDWYTNGELSTQSCQNIRNVRKWINQQDY